MEDSTAFWRFEDLLSNSCISLKHLTSSVGRSRELSTQFCRYELILSVIHLLLQTLTLDLEPFLEIPQYGVDYRVSWTHCRIMRVILSRCRKDIPLQSTIRYIRDWGQCVMSYKWCSLMINRSERSTCLHEGKAISSATLAHCGCHHFGLVTCLGSL